MGVSFGIAQYSEAESPQAQFIPTEVIFEGNHDVAQVWFWYPTDKVRDRATVVRATYDQDRYFELLYALERRIPAGHVGLPVLMEYSEQEGFVLVVDDSRVPIFGAIERHPIDWANSTCRVDADTTVGHRACLSNASLAWQQEISRAYRRLKLILPIEDSRKAWESYLEEQSALVLKSYEGDSGTIAGLLASDKITGLYKRHALTLNEVLEW